VKLFAIATREFSEVCLSLFLPKGGWPPGYGKPTIGRMIVYFREAWKDLNNPGLTSFLDICGSLNRLSRQHLHYFGSVKVASARRDKERDEILELSLMAVLYIQAEVSKAFPKDAERAKRQLRRVRAEQAQAEASARMIVEGAVVETSAVVLCPNTLPNTADDFNNDNNTDNDNDGDKPTPGFVTSAAAEVQMYEVSVSAESAVPVSVKEVDWASARLRQLEGAIEERSSQAMREHQEWAEMERRRVEAKLAADIAARSEALKWNWRCGAEQRGTRCRQRSMRDARGRRRKLAS
jgi:hypothetical protein